MKTACADCRQEIQGKPRQRDSWDRMGSIRDQLCGKCRRESVSRGRRSRQQVRTAARRR